MASRIKPLCILEHDEPTFARPGLLVCDYDRRRATSALRKLPELHEMLEEYLAEGSGSSGNEIVTTSRDPGLRMNNAVLGHRLDIEQCLKRWVYFGVGRVIVKRNAAGELVRTSRIERSGPTDLKLTTLAEWLIRNRDWYLAQENADHFVRDVTQVSGRARSLRQRNKVSKFEVGPCPEPDCGGTVIARMRPQDDLLPSKLWCDKAPTDPETGEQIHVWPIVGTAWHTLGVLIHKTAIQQHAEDGA